MSTAEQGHRSGAALTIQDLADELRCSKNHALRLVKGLLKDTPPLPAVKVGSHYVVRRTAFEAWLQKQENTAA